MSDVRLSDNHHSSLSATRVDGLLSGPNNW